MDKAKDLLLSAASQIQDAKSWSEDELNCILGDIEQAQHLVADILERLSASTNNLFPKTVWTRQSSPSNPDSLQTKQPKDRNMTKKKSSKKPKTLTGRDYLYTDKQVTFDSVEIDHRRNVRGLVLDKEGNPTYEKVDELAKAIKVDGLIQAPIARAVKPGHDDPNTGYELWGGFRRMEAVRKLGWKTVTVRVYPSETPDDVMYFLNLAENVQRKNIKPHQLAERCAMLAEEMELSGREIASRLGKSHGYVNDMLKCWYHLDPRIKEAWVSGDVRATTDRLCKDILHTHPEWKATGKAAGEKWYPIPHDEQWKLWLAVTGQKEAKSADDKPGEAGTGTDDKPDPIKRASVKALLEQQRGTEMLAEYLAKGEDVVYTDDYIRGVYKALSFALGQVDVIFDAGGPAQIEESKREAQSEKTPEELARKEKIAKAAAKKNGKANGKGKAKAKAKSGSKSKQASK